MPHVGADPGGPGDPGGTGDPGEHCTGCGRPAGECPTGGTCTGAFEPPRHCPHCGRRLRVLVMPTGWRARCRDHAEVGSGVPPATRSGGRPG